MIRLVSLADNVELEIKLKDLPRAKLTGIWLEVVDPTKEELQKVAEVSRSPLDFLLLPFLLLWRRKWLKTTFEALENHGS